MQELIIGFLLLFFSAFFSAAETAFFSLNAWQLEKLKKKNRAALGIERLKKEGGVLLSGILLGNMLANLGLSSFLTVQLERVFGLTSFWLSVIASSFFILIFGETIPKTIAFYKREKFALLALPFVKFFVFLSLPLARLINYLSLFLFRTAAKKEAVLEDLTSEEEFKVTLSYLKDSGLIRPQEEEMVKSVLEFNETEAAEIMTPRSEIQAVEINTSPLKARRIIQNSRHSFLVVFGNTIDNIKGIVSAKDFFLAYPKELKDLVKEAYFVPESKKIDSLLRDLQKKRTKLALVIDEYGGLAGLVTQEDILEEIFGEIYDEFEQKEEIIKKVNEQEFLVMAKVGVEEVNEALNINLPVEEKTLAGFILNLTERFPKRGETVKWHNLEFLIEKATARRIVLVKIKLK